DLTGDSGLYAAISRQMVESGNWLDLTINGKAYDQKPHLFFWLAGLGMSLFGYTNAAYKLFLFLAGAAGIYFTWRLARLLFSETAGRLAALFTGTAQLFFLYFLDIHTDTVLQSAVILSLWQLAAYLEHKKPVNFIVAFAAIGLAMLTKGPVGAVLPFFFVLFSLLLKQDYRQLIHPKWLAGIAIVLLMISPTLYHLWESFGMEGIRFYFIDNNIGRVTGELTGTSTDPFFYSYNLLWAFLPWTVPVVAGLAAEVKTWFNRRNIHACSASLLGSVLVLFIVYSVARGKAPNYLMMLMPPLAVVAAGRVQHFSAWSSTLKSGIIYAQYVILGFMVLLLPVTWYFVMQADNPWFPVVLIVLVVVLSLLFVGREPRSSHGMLHVSLVVAAAFNLYMNARVVPALFSWQGARQAVNIYQQDESAEKRLYSWDLEEYELFFMAPDSARNIATWEQMHEVMEKPGTWLYTNEWKHDEIVKMGFQIDTVYRIDQRGMNSVTLQILNAETREKSLEPNFLIKTKDDFN
ncbi:MAG: ArnT family glycosyltransferase, partial [Mariniphaga sp.]